MGSAWVPVGRIWTTFYWTWRRFCEETGYSHDTPLVWFKKYSLPITLAHRPSSAGKPAEPKPAPKETKPEVKKYVAPLIEAVGRIWTTFYCMWHCFSERGLGRSPNGVIGAKPL
jgi:hypothetical protein